MPSDWFERLFGFRESRDAVYANLGVSGEMLTSRANGESWAIGELTTPSLGELREWVGAANLGGGALRVRNVVGEAGALHVDPNNAGALFQAASQFNLLEMVGPGVTPEQGVTGYQGDHTQGPACAMAAAPAAVYRNWFAPVGDQIGQTAERQIDCFNEIHDALSPNGERLWQMRNGYALPTTEQLSRFDDCYQTWLSDGRDDRRDDLRAMLRIGLHRNVEVTRSTDGHRVSQAFCSALPLGYSDATSPDWQDFARLILEATYEATLWAAALNDIGRVFLTSVGGGVFGNDHQWIRDAMQRAFQQCESVNLDVHIVNYGRLSDEYRDLERG